MTNGWSDARDWLITLPTAQELAADIGAFGKGRLFRKDGLFMEKRSMSAMTATEVRASLSETLKSREYLDLLETLSGKKSPFKYFYLSEFPSYEKEEKPMIGMRQYVTAMKAPSKPPEPKVTPIVNRIERVADILYTKRIAADGVSIVLPEDDWIILRDEIEIYYNMKPKDDGSSLRYCGIEFLRGSAAPNADRSVWFKEIPANSMALTEEIIRCLSGGRFSKLPEGAGGNRVSASPDAGGKISVTSSPTISNNRNGNSARHIPDQLDVVSAKAAIAAYARDKKLPGSVSLAQLRELDDAAAAKKGVPRPNLADTIKGVMLDVIKSNRDSLSSESLSRAINQLNVAEDSGAHRDFIGAAAQGFAEMLDAGDASADSKRAHNSRR